jgi:hypothetical protein
VLSLECHYGPSCHTSHQHQHWSWPRSRAHCAQRDVSDVHKSAAALASCSLNLHCPHERQDPAFRAAAARKFLQLRAAEWSDAAVAAAIDTKRTNLRPAGTRTLTKCVAGEGARASC